MTLFGMTIVDAFLLSKGCSSALVLQNAPRFTETLATELIDNDYDKMSLQTRPKKRFCEVEAPGLSVNTTLYLTNPTPTKRL
jgi:hypothetical protein